MTFDEALAELGLEPDPDADAVRRAYLRLIKIRKPETDPEGFRRVREAYEIIRAGVGSAELVRSMRERTAGAAPTAGPSSPEADADAARRHEPPGTSAPAATARETAFLGFLKAWESVPPFADRTARVEIAREAVAALPAEPRAHWLLATSLSGMAPDAVLADALRAAHRLGHRGFLDALLTRTPRAARREEVDEAIRSDDSALRLAGAAACAPWDPAAAAAVVVEICGGAGRQTRPGDEADGEVDIPLGRALEVILILYAQGAVGHAATAERSLGAWIRARDLETTVARGPLGAVWLLTEEIARLPDDFPDALRRGLATATRAGDLTSAFHDACTFVRENRRASRPLLARLGTATPNVAATLSSAIETERARRKSLGWFRMSFLPRMILVPIVLAIVRTCTSSSVDHHAIRANTTAEVDPNVPNVPTVPTVPTVPNVAAPLPADVRMLDDASGPLCQGTETSTRVPCSDARILISDFLADNCDDATSRFRDIEARLARAKATPAESRFVTRAQLSLWQRCPAARVGGATPQPEDAP